MNAKKRSTLPAVPLQLSNDNARDLSATTDFSYNSSTEYYIKPSEMREPPYILGKNNKNQTQRKPSHLTPHRANKLSIFQFSIMIFVLTSAGPFGIETAVSSAGILYTLIGLMIVPLIYAIPQSLICSELSSMMPSNHGYILWVYRAFSMSKYGDFIGFINGFNCIAATATDLPIYPVLMFHYLDKLCRDQLNFKFGMFGEYLCKLSVVILGAILNIANIQVIGTCSIIITILILLPFLFGLIWSLPHMHPITQWFDTTPQNSNEEYDFSVFLPTMLWLWSGWDSMGCMIGEIGFKTKLIYIPFLIAVALNYLSYSLSLIGAATQTCNAKTDNKCWDEGYLYTAYNNIFDGLGIAITLGGLLSNIGLYLMALAAHTRSLWAVSQPSVSLLPNGIMLIRGETDADGGSESMMIGAIDDDSEYNNDVNNELNELQTMQSNLDESIDLQFLLRTINIDILPRNWFGTVWDKTGAPVKATLVTSVVNAILISFSFNVLVEASVFLLCFTYVFKYAAFVKLRYIEPFTKRPYQIPGGFIIAYLFAFLSFAVLSAVFVFSVSSEPWIFIGVFGFQILISIWYYVSRKWCMPLIKKESISDTDPQFRSKQQTTGYLSTSHMVI